MGLLEGAFSSKVHLLGLAGQLWQLRRQEHYSDIFLYSFLGLKMSTWKALGAPGEAHGVPFGEPKTYLKPLFSENGEHEEILVYTVFAPYYGA